MSWNNYDDDAPRRDYGWVCGGLPFNDRNRKPNSAYGGEFLEEDEAHHPNCQCTDCLWIDR